MVHDPGLAVHCPRRTVTTRAQDKIARKPTGRSTTGMRMDQASKSRLHLPSPKQVRRLSIQSSYRLKLCLYLRIGIKLRCHKHGLARLVKELSTLHKPYHPKHHDCTGVIPPQWPLSLAVSDVAQESSSYRQPILKENSRQRTNIASGLVFVIQSRSKCDKSARMLT